MSTRELSDDELDAFLADLGVSDHAKPEVGQLVTPPPLPDTLEATTIDKRKLGLIGGAIFLAGIILGLLLPQPWQSNGKLVEIQHQIDLLSEKISSYEALTDPEYEVIEPFAFPSPFDAAA